MKLSEKRSELKKHQIVLSAIKIVKEKGFEKATMEEIAAGLLMTKASLYYYFHNKEDLLYQCHNLVLHQNIERMEEILLRPIQIEEKFKEMLKLHIHFALDEKDLFNMIFESKAVFSREHYKEIVAMRKSYTSLWEKMIKEGVDQGFFKETEPYLTTMLLLGSVNWIHEWYQPHGTYTKEQITSHFQEKLLKVLH